MVELLGHSDLVLRLDQYELLLFGTLLQVVTPPLGESLRGCEHYLAATATVAQEGVQAPGKVTDYGLGSSKGQREANRRKN